VIILVANDNWQLKLHFHKVINCAAETRANLDDAVYKEGIYKLSINCANEAANQQVKRYVELSSGCVNSSEKAPLKEDCKLDPWTGVAKQKLKVEKELAHINSLSYTVVRLPVVYGIGDKRYLSEYQFMSVIVKHSIQISGFAHESYKLKRLNQKI